MLYAMSSDKINEWKPFKRSSVRNQKQIPWHVHLITHSTDLDAVFLKENRENISWNINIQTPVARTKTSGYFSKGAYVL